MSKTKMSAVSARAVDGCFTFSCGEHSYASRPWVDVITPGFMRRNRDRDSMDATYTLLEELFAEDQSALEALDSMSWPEHNKVVSDLGDEFARVIEVTMGESSAS